MPILILSSRPPQNLLPLAWRTKMCARLTSPSNIHATQSHRFSSDYCINTRRRTRFENIIVRPSLSSCHFPLRSKYSWQHFELYQTLLTDYTERKTRVVGTLASYSGVSGFKSPSDWPDWGTGWQLVTLLSTYRIIPGLYLKLSLDSLCHALLNSLLINRPKTQSRSLSCMQRH
jgi:hypothetical protein